MFHTKRRTKASLSSLEAREPAVPSPAPPILEDVPRQVVSGAQGDSAGKELQAAPSGKVKKISLTPAGVQTRGNTRSSNRGLAVSLAPPGPSNKRYATSEEFTSALLPQTGVDEDKEAADAAMKLRSGRNRPLNPKLLSGGEKDKSSMAHVGSQSLIANGVPASKVDNTNTNNDHIDIDLSNMTKLLPSLSDKQVNLVSETAVEHSTFANPVRAMSPPKPKPELSSPSLFDNSIVGALKTQQNSPSHGQNERKASVDLDGLQANTTGTIEGQSSAISESLLKDTSSSTAPTLMFKSEEEARMSFQPNLCTAVDHPPVGSFSGLDSQSAGPDSGSERLASKEAVVQQLSMERTNSTSSISLDENTHSQDLMDVDSTFKKDTPSSVMKRSVTATSILDSGPLRKKSKVTSNARHQQTATLQDSPSASKPRDTGIQSSKPPLKSAKSGFDDLNDPETWRSGALFTRSLDPNGLSFKKSASKESLTKRTTDSHAAIQSSHEERRRELAKRRVDERAAVLNNADTFDLLEQSNGMGEFENEYRFAARSMSMDVQRKDGPQYPLPRLTTFGSVFSMFPRSIPPPSP